MMVCVRRVATLAFVLFFSALLTVPAAHAQEDSDALADQVNALYQQGKYAEALPLAERQVELMKAQHGEEHPDYAAALSDLANVLQRLNRAAEAEALFRKAIAIDEASLGPTHEDLATDLKGLGALLRAQSRIAEAETVYRRVLSIDETNHGPSDAIVAEDLGSLALVLSDAGRLAEAEPLTRRALEITESLLGPDHPDVARRLNSLATVLVEATRYTEAEPLLRRALAITETHAGPDSLMAAVELNNLAQILVRRSAFAQAEPLMRRALEIDQSQPIVDEARVAADLTNLAALLLETSRPSHAEPLLRRALALDEARLGPNHPRVALHLNNLSQVLTATNRSAEAEPLLRRSLAINEAALGPNHPMVAKNLNNLALVLQAFNRSAEAEPLMRRAVAIDEAIYGPDNAIVAEALNNLAFLLKGTGSLGEVEPLMRRVLAIFEKELGPDHPHVATALGNLALLLAERGDWEGALGLITRSGAMRTADARRNSGGSAETLRRLVHAGRADQLVFVLSAYHTRANRKDSVNDSFVAAQRALGTEAAAAVAEASARFAAGTGPLAELVRSMQDTSAARAAADRKLLAALTEGNKDAAASLRAEESQLGAKLDEITARLAREFPDYTALANPEPLTIEAVQRLLKPGEVFIQFLNLGSAGKLPESGFVWAISKSDVRWASLDHGTLWFQAGVALMRCGLDRTNWADASDWPEDTQQEKDSKAEQLTRREQCKKATGVDDVENRPLPFPLIGAYNFYRSLFGGIEDMIKGKQLLIVPSGALTALPFQVLITQEPAAKVAASGADYTNAAWLGRSNAITVLPSAASLQALRRVARPTKASQPFAGFGNPLLIGPFGNNNRAWAKQDCAKLGSITAISAVPRGFTPPSLASLGVTDVEGLRRQWPLPETADELCNVAGVLGAPPSTVHLGRDATERRVKQLSARGELAQARVIHFATHGLLPGETEMVGQVRPEPALMLTPPDRPSEEDNGLLTASEVAQLQLDADWVVLSACNTAAASESRAEEDLSGLARAFFYAGARALLVSHWYVDSQGTVALITKTFAAMKADPHIGRAEALRRAISALIAEGGGMEHPGKWAPFVVVGEGGGE